LSFAAARNESEDFCKELAGLKVKITTLRR